ncbi:SDR family oxidoreductase [bacterium]|nr:SDR family oxidoreductase [bacterium]
MPTMFVTGANRGIGYALAREFAKRGYDVIATCRDPKAARGLNELARSPEAKVEVHPLDVTDHARVDELARELKDRAIDVLINNAGVMGPKKERLGAIDFAAFRDVLEVNTIAPLKIAEAFRTHVAASERKTVVSITSEMGSIAQNTYGSHYPYKTSKAALNMAMRTYAMDVKDAGIIAIVICPGWVQTDMGGANAALKPAESARTIANVIEQLTPENSGHFFSQSGKQVPW